MNERKRLQNQLLEVVGTQLSQYGFNPKPKGQSFQRKEEFGKTSCHLSFIRHESDFDITADVAIRFDTLQDLVTEHMNDLSEKEKREMFSMGAELGYLSGGGQQRWTVVSEIDVAPVATKIVELFKTVGEPFLNKYSSLNEAYKVFSGDDNKSGYLRPGHSYRAMYAVGLAFLMGQTKEQIENLIQSKKTFLEKRKDMGFIDHGMDQFHAFLEWFSPKMGSI